MAAFVTGASHRARWSRPLVGLALAGACAAGLAAPAAAAPDGRAYELVSPADKNNGGVIWGHRSTADGNAVAFMLNAPVTGDDNAWVTTSYVARRSADGWSGLSAAPPVQTEHRGISELRGYPLDFSDDLSSVILYTNDRLDPDDGESVESGNVAFGFDLFEYDVAARATDWLSRPLPSRMDAVRPGRVSGYGGRSLDGRHVVFQSAALTDDVLPGDEYILHEAYPGGVRAVSVVGGDIVAGTLATGVETQQAQVGRNQAISADGSRIYFTGLQGLFLRENGATTLAVSASQRAGSIGDLSANVRLLATTEDGATAYFWASGPLTDDAGPDGGVYSWSRDGESLRFLAPLGDDFNDVAVATDDAARVYFTSMSALDGSVAPVRNLYLLEDGAIRLVASPGDKDVTFFGIDPGLRISPDGRFAVFTSGLDLTDAADHAGFSGVYLYDADSGDVVCASCRGDGEPSAGHALLRSEDAAYSVLVASTVNEPRDVTTDGRVYFQTTESLTPTDVNGRSDVYEFDPAGGRQTLITPGTGEASFLIDNSEDGRSVFFFTANSLVARDSDGYPDVYVARVGGGFADDAVPPQACNGDDCQGVPTPQPNRMTPPSALVDGPEQVDDPPARTQPEPTLRVVRPGASAVRSLSRGGRAVVRVTINRAGRVALVARARVGRSDRTVAHSARNARAGTVSLPLQLGALARRQLASGRALRIRVTITHAGIRRTLTLRVPAGRGR